MRIGVIGLGSIGARRAKILREMGHAVKVFDTSSKILFDQGNANQYKVYGNAEDLYNLGKPEAVIICTPPGYHYQNTLEAMIHDVPFFLEKPIDTDNLVRWRTLANGATMTGVVNMVACNMRFHEGVKIVSDMVDKIPFEDVLYARFHTGSYLPIWRPGTDFSVSNSASTGVIFDAMWHELDLALHMLNDDSRRIYARLRTAAWTKARSLDLECPGIAEITLSQGDCLTSVHANFVQRNYDRGIKIVRTKSTIVGDWKEGTVKAYVDNGDQFERGFDPDDALDIMYEREMTYFLNCVETHSRSFNSLNMAIRVMELLIQATEVGRE